MNIQELNIIKYLHTNAYMNQRELAEVCDCSLGMVNRCLKSLECQGLVNEYKELTAAASRLLRANSPRRAVILAAGPGMRMVPVNMEHPKAMLEVCGEVLIERLIRQLQQSGIREIYVVVGFMKEAFEYLIDDYGVELIVNRDYASFNNLHSLALAADKLSNAYVLPCDIWCRDNPFSPVEAYSWYMVTDHQDRNSEIRVNRKQELIRTRRGELGNPMAGICYLTGRDGETLRRNLQELCRNYLYDHAFWEEALYREDKMIPMAKVVPGDQILEVNTYSQLRDLELKSDKLKNQAIAFACRWLDADPAEIQDIRLLKKGMTNQSFLFSCRNRRYVIRLPRPGADQFVDWSQERAVYQALEGRKLSEDVLTIDERSGCKITRYMENARHCDPEKEADVVRCMAALRSIHSKKLQVSHREDLFEKINFYQQLWKGRNSAYRDYETTRKQVFSLQSYISSHAEKAALTHMDPVADNFLFYEDMDGEEQLRLIDWECAAMQDPHVDIAMFCISALYGKDQIDRVIDLYFEEHCPPDIRIKIYCYVAVCGLMWSNWCEYQLQNGAEFGEYSLKQYRYAKEFYRYALDEIRKQTDSKENQL